MNGSGNIVKRFGWPRVTKKHYINAVYLPFQGLTVVKLERRTDANLCPYPMINSFIVVVLIHHTEMVRT